MTVPASTDVGTVVGGADIHGSGIPLRWIGLSL